MIWRMIDWIWICILALCCCCVGGLRAFDRAVSEGMTAEMKYQPFIALLTPEVEPKDRMKLRGELLNLHGIREIKWLSPEEVLARVYRERLSDEEFALIKDQLPQVVELMVPTESLLRGHFDPHQFDAFPQVENYFWDETSVSTVYEEKQHWNLHIQQMMLGLLIACTILVVVSFLLTTERNQMRVVIERAGLNPETQTKVALSEFYHHTGGIWFKAMVAQAIAASLLALAFFLTFNQILSTLDSAPEISLLSVTDWRFLWACGAISFLGKGLDLIRVRLKLESSSIKAS